MYSLSMTNANALAKLAIEVWRSSGERTIERLHHLVRLYATTHFGPASSWPTAILDLVAQAHIDADRLVPRFLVK